jgi:hypothetical protein
MMQKGVGCWAFGVGFWVLAIGSGAQEVTPPRSFEAIAVSPTEIRLYWLPADAATGYRVERDGQTLASLPASATGYADTTLTSDASHRYVLRAVQNDRESAPREYVERAFAPFPGNSRTPASYDVVAMQASSGGVAAAIEAARRGLKVALLEPTTRLGGMPVNGLSATDLRRPEHASGFFVRFRDRVRDLYAQEGIKATGLQYEPRIAHQAMQELLYAQPNVTVFRRVRLAKVRARDTVPDGSRRRVEAVIVEELNADGQPTGRRAELKAKVFIDATDCGDLAAWAGAPFRLGREHRSPHEPHNGVIYYDRANDKALPGSTGETDKRIQSYAYLLTVKDYGPSADKTIPKPPGYRKENFIHTPAWEQSWAVTSGKMPNGKYELNQHPQGNDYQEINYHYPTGDYRERARVEKLYRERVLGYLYYIQTEQGQKQLGLPDDEYRDSGGFPPLLYVREGRRIEGEQTPDESEIAQARRLIRPESLGLGDYPMDSHAVRPKTDWTTPDMGEGEWWLYQYTPWHSLPLGILVPKRLENVFVTTAVSSTHASFGTYRLEPARMAFGQAAGIAANLCIRYRLDARDVPARQVQDDLLPHPDNPCGDPDVFLYYLSDVPPTHRHARAIQYLSARGFQFTAEELKPDAPTTRGELAQWMTRLAERAAPVQQEEREGNGHRETVSRYAYYPYMGAPANQEAVKRLQQAPNPTEPITRAEFARWLYDILPPGKGRTALLPTTDRYADLDGGVDRNVFAALYGWGIDSWLWDGWDAYAPEGKLYFRPKATLSHADLFAALYRAQMPLGPLFFDNPVDGRNGRAVPPVLFDTAIK